MYATVNRCILIELFIGDYHFFFDAFAFMLDPRRKQAKCYDFDKVLAFATLAILSDASSYRRIYEFIRSHFKKFKKKFNLKWKKAPSYGTIRNIIISANSDELEDAFRKFTKHLHDNLCEVDDFLELSFDGKVIRGSYDNFNQVKAMQILSVFCSNSNLILAHEIIVDKTNEIPIAQGLIPELNIKGNIFTCDALNCQVGTIQAAIDSGNDIIVQAKGNQKSLLQNCRDTCKNEAIIGEYSESANKGHGKIVSRTVNVFNFTDHSADNRWKNITQTVEVCRYSQKYDSKKGEWKDMSEKSYYLSTKTISAEMCNSIIRHHWGIENKNHNVKDTSMKEDASRIRIKPQNMVILRSFALNILRYNKKENIANAMYCNVLNVNKLWDLKGILEN